MVAPAKKTALKPLPGIVVSSVRTTKVEWLWYGRIPIGKLTMLDGNPGLGKSMLTVDIAARVSTGAPFYGSEDKREPGAVLIITNEDDLGDTIRPRLISHHANVDIVRHDMRLSFPSGLDELQELCRFYRETDTPLRLVIVDPFHSFIDEGVDANSPSAVTQALSPLVALASNYKFAPVIIRHLSKGNRDGAAVTRGAGAIAIIGLARSGILIGPDPDEKGVRILSMTKTNLMKDPGSLRYRIADDEEGRPVVQWMGSSEHDAEELVAPPPSKRVNGRKRPDTDSQVGLAIDWLFERLKRGPELASSLFLDARRAGFPDPTLKRAKVHLPISSSREKGPKGTIRGWIWSLDTMGTPGGGG